jgi:glycosyltransferase involved in cell wall biosynthesis
MVTPHMPPEQSANALLPVLLGDALVSQGVSATYVSHPPLAGPPDASGRVRYVPRRGRDRFSRSLVGAVAAGTRMMLGARDLVRQTDLVHLHSNGFIVEVGQWLARRYRKPYVITLYGTDISSHEPSRHARYNGVVRSAAARVFYSKGLLHHAQRLGLAHEPSLVIYAPVNSRFSSPDDGQRAAIRRDLGISEGPVLLTVKRLHPLAGHDTLLGALRDVIRSFPDAALWLIGDGELRVVLQQRCRDLGIAAQVNFLGSMSNDRLGAYYAAADLFVLPSQTESWGTVMLEALACGTPVVTTDTVGGIEIGEAFPQDVAVVPKGNASELAAAIVRTLPVRRRTSPATRERIRRDFSVTACASQYLEVYRKVLGH